MDEVVPEDSEGEMLCPKIPVVQGAPGSQEIADNVTRALVIFKTGDCTGTWYFCCRKNS